MPNMNGLQLLAEIKGDDKLKHLPRLMTTAEARKEDIVAAVLWQQAISLNLSPKPHWKRKYPDLKKMGL